MIRVTGWRAMVLLLIVGAITVAVAITLLWAAAVLAVLGCVLWLNVWIIPRLARRLGVPRAVLDAVVLASLCAGGWLVGGVNGVIVAGVVWLASIGVPRVVGVWVRRRQPYVAPADAVVIEAVIADSRPDPTHLPASLPGTPD